VQSKELVDLKRDNMSMLEHYEAQAELKEKENQILFLRIKYLRQSVDVLMRQKVFVLESLDRSKE